MVARPEYYIRIHKRKAPCTELVEWEERINEDMSANSGSPMTITDDAVTSVAGKDSRGCCRAMGPGVNKTAMKRMEPVLDQNYHLAEENSKLWKETQTNQMNFAMQLEEIRSTMLSRKPQRLAKKLTYLVVGPLTLWQLDVLKKLTPPTSSMKELPRGTRATNITVIPSLMACPSITPNVPSSICLAMSLITGLHSNPVDFYLSTGSELFLEILGLDIVGGLFLPMLGALPDALLILAEVSIQRITNPQEKRRKEMKQSTSPEQKLSNTYKSHFKTSGQKITWLTPHALQQVLSDEVDLKLMWFIVSKLCELLPLQSYKKPISSVQRSVLVDKTRPRPRERMEVLDKGLNFIADNVGLKTNKYNVDPMLHACGISIDSQPAVVQSHVLSEPKVLAGSYFSVAGALVGLLKPSMMSMFGTLLVIWGLVKEGLLGKPVNTDPAKAC
ncbi:hypothetical protein IFM89_035011 [Coptis chinensis]|uniref:Uncharacterized protein n=1 Tax=Coptis chinensis TaxID=261450 RepID=A0A835ISI0_9MAGN|nr:hypothetical protein IFM89_035011 [Coptis chinensis]